LRKKRMKNVNTGTMETRLLNITQKLCLCLLLVYNFTPVQCRKLFLISFSLSRTRCAHSDVNLNVKLCEFNFQTSRDMNAEQYKLKSKRHFSTVTVVCV